MIWLWAVAKSSCFADRSLIIVLIVLKSGKTHITVRSHECPTSLMLARRVETSLAQGVKGRFWSCPAARDVSMLVYRRVHYGVGILFQGCSTFDRLSSA